MFNSMLLFTVRAIFQPWKLLPILTTITAVIFVKVFWSKMFLLYLVTCALAITFCRWSPAECATRLGSFAKYRLLRMKSQPVPLYDNVMPEAKPAI